MKELNKILIFKFVAIGAFFILTNSCTKSDDNINDPPSTNGIIFNPGLSYGTVTDIDGNVYRTIKIGTQTWMAENLRTTKYRNGQPIHKAVETLDWSNDYNGAYCENQNDSSTAKTYGMLYNWYAVNNSQNIAPAGWHVPAKSEWTTLIDYLGGEEIAGGKMKETGSVHWISPNTGATNESGFTGLPGSFRTTSGYFFGTGGNGVFWSSTEESSINAWNYSLGYNHAHLTHVNSLKEYGNSIRCIKD